MDKFRGALLTGDISVAVEVFSTGNVNVSCPYTIYANNMYPIHW
jgi:hypothetical protein